MSTLSMLGHPHRHRHLNDVVQVPLLTFGPAPVSCSRLTAYPQAYSRTHTLFAPSAACTPPSVTLAGRSRAGITLSTTTPRPFLSVHAHSASKSPIRGRQRQCPNAHFPPQPLFERDRLPPPMCRFELEHSLSASTMSIRVQLLVFRLHRLGSGPKVHFLPPLCPFERNRSSSTTVSNRARTLTSHLFCVHSSTIAHLPS